MGRPQNQSAHSDREKKIPASARNQMVVIQTIASHFIELYKLTSNDPVYVPVSHRKLVEF